jgi:hypothetical protein
MKLKGNALNNVLATVPEAYKLYSAGESYKAVAWSCFGVSLGCLLVGLYTGLEQTRDNSPHFEYLYWYGASLLIDIPLGILMRKGSSKIVSAVGIYNDAISNQQYVSDVSLHFGTTQSGGIGLTLHF